MHSLFLAKEKKMGNVIKHTFIETTLQFEDGELVEKVVGEKEYRFSLNMKGLDLFEREYGKPLIKTLTKVLKTIDFGKLQAMQELGEGTTAEIMDTIDNLIDPSFLKALACSSYISIVDSQPINNDYTKEQFKESFAYQIMLNDMDFIIKLLNMAIECVFTKQKKKTSGNDNRKN